MSYDFLNITLQMRNRLTDNSKDQRVQVSNNYFSPIVKEKMIVNIVDIGECTIGKVGFDMHFKDFSSCLVLRRICTYIMNARSYENLAISI